MFLGKLIGRRRESGDVESLRNRLKTFRSLIEGNNRVLELMADAGEKLGGEYVFDIQYLRSLAGQLEVAVREVVNDLNVLTGYRHNDLAKACDRIHIEIRDILDYRDSIPRTDYVLELDRIGIEAADAVGEKMARLGEIRRRLDCPVPAGFAITAFACRSFLEQTEILPLLEAWRAAVAGSCGPECRAAAERLQEAIRKAPVPAELRRAVSAAAAAVQRKKGCTAFAVRSSAVGEDGAGGSFAGQYATRLGVPPDGIVAAYREVVASLFSPAATSYRRRMGIHPIEYVMPVGCLCMVESRTAGVLHTLDPSDPGSDTMLIEAAWGLGTVVADGSGAVDRFVVSRAIPHTVVSRSIATKQEMIVAAAGGGVRRAKVEEAGISRACLSETEILGLAATGLRIERYMKCAQDIEWAIDRQGRLFVLQCRPLAAAARMDRKAERKAVVPESHRILMRAQGTIACRGVAAGRVRIVLDGKDLENIPDNAVLVARVSSPQLAAALGSAAAVITDLGTTTGHLATIAREFRVPMIVSAENATRVLPDGEEVTVDAEDNIVYQGIVGELLRDHLLARNTYEDAEEFRLLRKILKKVAPLHLSDPQSPQFTARNCASYHDVIRFAHEKAVEYVIGQAWLARVGPEPYARRLEMAVPLDLVVVDLGGGMRATRPGETVRLEELSCPPLQALLDGLQTPGAWSSAPADMDTDGFLSSATRIGPLIPPAARPLQNLAIVSDRYLHLSLNLGYHFNIVDCYMSEAQSDNFIYFRFAGGATELARRERRARVLRAILGKYDFMTEAKGDLVIGRIKAIPAAEIEERLRMIGRLIGCTRQLDVFLRDDDAIERCVNRFMTGQWDLAGG